jgi:hypothetical protein
VLGNGWLALGRRKSIFRVRDFAKRSFTEQFIRKILVPVTRAWFDTCRVRVLNERIYREYFLSDKPIVAGTWHRAAIYFLYFFEKLRPMIMISQSKDGEILAQYAAGFGVVPARGSSHKGGLNALKQMQHYLSGGGKACATVLDGPQGPAYVAKKGMIHLAKISGAPLIPIIWSADRVLTVRDSWDKTMLPLPWSRVCIAFGDPITIPADAGSQALHYYRKLVQDRLNGMTIEVDRLCGQR